MAWCTPDIFAIRDKDGFTALHLAVKSVEKVESSRPVKALLLRDAPKFIRDKNGNLPVDIAEQI